MSAIRVLLGQIREYQHVGKLSFGQKLQAEIGRGLAELCNQGLRLSRRSIILATMNVRKTIQGGKWTKLVWPIWKSQNGIGYNMIIRA